MRPRRFKAKIKAQGRAVRMGSGRRTKIALSRETQLRSSKFEGGPLSFAAACGLSGGDGRRAHRGAVLSGLPSGFDSHLRAGLSRSSVEMVTIDPLDLQAAQERDAAMPNALLEDGVAELLA